MIPVAPPPNTKYASDVWAEANGVPTIGSPSAALTSEPSGRTLALFGPPYSCFSRSGGQPHCVSPAALKSTGQMHAAAPVGTSCVLDSPFRAMPLPVGSYVWIVLKP